MVAARDRVLEMGGPTKANVFTKIQLALFGEYDWNGVPTMPAEIMLLPPPFFLFNIYEVSYWSRCVIVPLLIIMDRKPIKWLPSSDSRSTSCGRCRASRRACASRACRSRSSWRGLFWKSVFIGVDDGLKIWERFSPRPLRKRAIDAARLWLEERLAVPGRARWHLSRPWPTPCWPCACSAIPEDHPLILGQLKEIEALAVETATSSTISPAPRRCGTPRWRPTR